MGIDFRMRKFGALFFLVAFGLLASALRADRRCKPAVRVRIAIRLGIACDAFVS